uniref:Trafficking kinesin-binding protein milt n=1 Tax=Timema douglasi TaxID=61478 RepID=A0A7R8VIL5_TIMDO|nr:unnamed protein product [Timema douglasi]
MSRLLVPHLQLNRPPRPASFFRQDVSPSTPRAPPRPETGERCRVEKIPRMCGQMLSNFSVVTLRWECSGREKSAPQTWLRFTELCFMVRQADIVLPTMQVLCSNRVSQMTKTYNDIEAVTRLLEEKEKDLELTARIGKELLAHNQKLETNVAALEAELKSVNERLTQLSHELIRKTELIQVLTNDVDDSSSEAGTPTGLQGINLDLMHRRIGSLEEENKQLRNEASQLSRDTDDCEEAEQRLVRDIASQLANANMEVDGMADELQRYKEESRQQHEKNVKPHFQANRGGRQHCQGKPPECNSYHNIWVISTLVYCKSDALDHSPTEAGLNSYFYVAVQLTVDNEKLAGTLQVTKDNQSKLATELADLKDRYAEVMSLLHDTQEQLRRQRRKGMPQARGGSLFPSLSTTVQPDSLASELESSLYSDFSLDSGISTDRPNYKKVFETVRCASRNSDSKASSTIGSPIHHLYPRGATQLNSVNTMLSSMSTTSGPRISSYVPPHMGGSRPPLESQGRIGGSVYSSSLSFPSIDSMGHSDSEFSVVTDSDDGYPGGARSGVPGCPGAADLEAALRRLTPAEVLARRATLSSESYTGYDYTDGSQTPPTYLPFGCRTPDSIMSTGSSGYSGRSGMWKLPEKLQIVKPLEGSLTLATWAQLATPTLGGLLDERPGVKTRGGRPLEELGLELYSLSDLEEDEEYANPGKSFQGTGSVYTFTTSTILHPDDTTSVTPSLRGSQMCTVSNSHQNTPSPPTPVCLSRRGSTITFSTTLGLAKLLNERGIKAVTPSAVSTPCGDRSFTPTATPCNSPDGTPPPSPPPSPPPYSSLKFPSFLNSGADLLRRTLIGEADRGKARKIKRNKMALSRSDRKALTGIRLVEKLERIGLETIMSTTASAMSTLTLQGALYTRRTNKSPMTQLTSLKSTISTPRQERTHAAQHVPAATPPPSPVHGELGVPGHPGSMALENGLGQLGRKQKGAVGMVRPDLGMVLGTVPAKRSKPEELSTLGTISSLLFGRKGGLL